MLGRQLALSETERLRTDSPRLSENYLDLVSNRIDVSDIHFGWVELMPRIFAYVRVSTTGQTTENQIREIEAAGFMIEPRRVVSETISGSIAAANRRGFVRLVDKLETGDILVVTKLDRLGRNAMDVRATVDRLAALGVRVHCLALGGADLTSAGGKMTMQVIAAVAEFERDLLVERTQAGLARAKAEGKSLGRPGALTHDQREDVVRRLDGGATVSALAREYDTSRQTILRVRNAAATLIPPMRGTPCV